MMSAATIREISSKNARDAKRRGQKPMIMTSKKKDNIRRGMRISLPFLGDYVPEGFHLINSVMVDSSGFGIEGERAMTQKQFIDSMEIGKAYAIVEAGQFQVWIGIYGVN